MSDITVCSICGNEKHPYAQFCKRCRKFVNRVDMRNKVAKEARVEALKQAWDGEGFRCHYTNIRLIENNPKDPRYLSFDHRTPRVDIDIVVCATLINDMKTDMSEDEFTAMVRELNRKFESGSFNESVFDLKYWTR